MGKKNFKHTCLHSSWDCLMGMVTSRERWQRKISKLSQERKEQGGRGEGAREAGREEEEETQTDKQTDRWTAKIDRVTGREGERAS